MFLILLIFYVKSSRQKRYVYGKIYVKVGKVNHFVKKLRKKGKDMTAIQLKKDEYLVHKGEPMKAIYIVLRGLVNLKTEYNEIPLGSGSVLGLVPGDASAYVCDYVAAEDSLVASYKYDSPDDFVAIFAEQPKYSYAFLHAAITQCKTIYERYFALEKRVKLIADFVTRHCSEYELNCSQAGFEIKEVAVAELQQMSLPEAIREWEIGYFKDIMEQEV